MTQRPRAGIVWVYSRHADRARGKGSRSLRSTQVIVILLALLALAACGSAGVLPTITSAPHLITFNVSRISVEPSGKTHIELAVANSGTQELPADKFVAHLELSHADGRLRAAQDAVLPRIPPSTGDLTTVISLQTPLEPGEYHMSWGASGLGSTLVIFEIEAEGSALRLGKQVVDYLGPGYLHPHGTAVH